MAEAAFQIQFRQETIAAFEQHSSLLRESVTTEAVIKGNQATFLVAGSGNAQAVTRGLNGLIPGRPDDLVQNTATLVEWHDKPVATRYNIFASQGDRNQIMQRTAIGTISRKIDEDIINELNTATNDTGAAVPATLDMAVHAKTILGNLAVPLDGNVFGLITPAFEANLLKTKEFGNDNYVSYKPLEGGTAWVDRPGYYSWLGVKWIVHPNLPGKTTNAEKCFMYHKNAIGHAADINGLHTNVGYNDEHDYSFCLASMFMGAKLLQNSGVVVMNHNGENYAAQ